ncbi:hypothetical protein GA0061071_103299 [Kosakonia oryzendophytica]|uniref:Uncharacterized protein n=1 Tax=Kosakonia oryzendophytica TaxID=1005665 RepID=A0A1C4AST1_9ENTR|nr:hypothetical protein DFO53_2426 [Enterobacter sp. AG5470]SCB97653.1 hypothetical protein GA0061071_103299 [Kosakonia oryzendophytica]
MRENKQENPSEIMPIEGCENFLYIDPNRMISTLISINEAAVSLHLTPRQKRLVDKIANRIQTQQEDNSP